MHQTRLCWQNKRLYFSIQGLPVQDKVLDRLEVMLASGKKSALDKQTYMRRLRVYSLCEEHEHASEPFRDIWIYSRSKGKLIVQLNEFDPFTASRVELEG